MIVFDRVSIRYPDSERPVLRNVDLTIDDGEFILVVGRTGVGKSTLLQAINGLVPYFTGGTLSGSVTVDGLSTIDYPPRELAHVVGMVGQDPLAGFVTDTVEEELAHAMEQLGLPPDVMRKRVEETLDLLGIADLRGRALRTLSGGQQQRVAIGSVLTAGSRILVLDEPTSALDPTSAEEVLAALLRLVHDLGVTVLVAEHRMERVVGYADRVAYLPGDGSVSIGDPADMLARTDIAPPLVELGRAAGWSPLPLSIRDARRLAGTLRTDLAALDPTTLPTVAAGALPPDPTLGETPLERPTDGGLTAERITVSYGDQVAVSAVDLRVRPGEIVGLMGRNGSGKSSLLWAVTGVGRMRSGRSRVNGEDPRSGNTRGLVALVPQTASDLLYLDTVAAECAAADQESGRPAGSCRALLDDIAPGIDGLSHPRDLSEGQKLSLVLAIQLTARPSVVLLDEPTRGLDYLAKSALGRILRRLADLGRAIVVATHDVEFAASVCGRVVVMATGEVVADGPATEVLAASPSFAPQVAKVLAPAPWLTVDQVKAGLTIIDPARAASGTARG